MKTIRDFDFKNKRVLVRCDFNVPIKNGIIENDFRIRQAIPTLKLLLEKGAQLILMSHLGDKGDLGPVWKRVKEEIGSKDVVFLENIRLHKEEKENDEEFAKELASLADIYINDAFGVCHRNHASVSAITKFLPSGAGLLLEKEVAVLSGVLDNPSRPLVAIIGGAKFESKAKMIGKFLEIADYVLVGGKIAYNRKIDSPKAILSTDTIDKKDIGPETIKKFSEVIEKAKTIVWAGPLGMFEKPRYEKGTKIIGQKIIQNKEALKVAGGGDTISAIFKFNLENGFDHLSTGGGAMLAFLGGEELPGLKALNYYAKD